MQLPPPPGAGPDNSGNINEAHETARETTPRVYVASLSDYNAGRLHGDWIDADQEPEELGEQINAMLARSIEPGAEEWAIHDYDGFGPLQLGEYITVEHITTLARGIAEHGRAFAHWAEHLGQSQWEHLNRFEDSYLGSWPSAEEFAESMLEDMGIDVDALGPEHLQSYVSFDLAAFARDLAFDFHICDDEDGVHVFDETL